MHEPVASQPAANRHQNRFQNCMTKYSKRQFMGARSKPEQLYILKPKCNAKASTHKVFSRKPAEVHGKSKALNEQLKGCTTLACHEAKPTPPKRKAPSQPQSSVHGTQHIFPNDAQHKHTSNDHRIINHAMCRTKAVNLRYANLQQRCQRRMCQAFINCSSLNWTCPEHHRKQL